MNFRRRLSNRHGRPRRMLTMDIHKATEPFMVCGWQTEMASITLRIPWHNYCGHSQLVVFTTQLHTLSFTYVLWYFKILSADFSKASIAGMTLGSWLCTRCHDSARSSPFQTKVSGTGAEERTSRWSALLREDLRAGTWPSLSSQSQSNTRARREPLRRFVCIVSFLQSLGCAAPVGENTGWRRKTRRQGHWSPERERWLMNCSNLSKTNLWLPINFLASTCSAQAQIALGVGTAALRRWAERRCH